MKKEWILWNALQNPEEITADERTEQIEWKNYYWSYKVLQQMLFLLAIFWPSIALLSKSYIDNGRGIETLPNLFVLQIIVLIESGRFLYSCYFGNQEFYDRSRGRTMYLVIGLEIAVFTWIVFWRGLGFWHPLLWVMLALSPFFYWGLCHLAYLHHALLTDDATEEAGRKSEAWIPAVCGALLALYFLMLNVFLFTTKVDNTALSHLTEEELKMINTVERGIDNYYALDDYKLEYTFQTNWLPETPIYNENQNYDLAHAYGLYSGEESYTQILIPGSEEAIYREYHRESTDPLSWKIAYEGHWISESEWAKLWTEHPEESEFWINEPYTGLPNIDPKTVTSVTKEEQNENTRYTITYKGDYNYAGATLKDNEEITGLTAQDRYTLNEYNTLIQYEHTETGFTKTEEKPRTLKRTFTILSVNKEAIQSELQTLKTRYSNK